MPGLLRQNDRAALHKLFIAAYAGRQELADFLLRNLRLVADATNIKLSSATTAALQDVSAAGKAASQTLLELVLGELQTACASAIDREDQGFNLLRRCVTNFINAMPNALSKAFFADKVETLAKTLRLGVEAKKPTNSYLQEVNSIATKISDILKDLAMQETRSFRFLLPLRNSTPRLADLVDMPRDELVAVAEAFALSQYEEDSYKKYLTVISKNVVSSDAAEQPRTALATSSLVLESVRIVDEQLPEEVDLGQRFRILAERTGLSTRDILSVQSERIALGIFQDVHNNMRDPLSNERIETVNKLDEFILKSVKRDTGEILTEAEETDGHFRRSSIKGSETTAATLYIQIRSQVARRVKYLFASELVAEIKIEHQTTQKDPSLLDMLRKSGAGEKSDFRRDLPLMFMVDSMYDDCGKDTLDQDYWARYALKAEMLRSLYQRYSEDKTAPTVDDFILSMFGVNVETFRRSKRVEARSSKLLIQRTFQSVVKGHSYLDQCRQDEATFLNELGVSLQKEFSRIIGKNDGEPPRQTPQQLISIIQPVVGNASLERDAAAELRATIEPFPYSFPPRHQHLIAKYLPSIMLEKLETGKSAAAASFDQSSELCKELYRRQGWALSPVTKSIQLNLSPDHMAHRIISRLLRDISQVHEVTKVRLVAVCSGAATLSLAYQDIEAAMFEGSRRSEGALLRQWTTQKKPDRYKGA
ncbi:hypothetical protein TGRUB_235580 [Toxoplasma gondii RUB]|uniref:Uncharacterized protein n=9 Tax=Toxoplasma gondii TaxID=5811 RepID=B9PW73_TOXGV|nr:hypothetical protein TGGT1_235580 [Toxoplasma gondii GT1]ESS30903.1 hypothetical protein TGVEG_235580 [Toxoplasma gondii VEG]KAF4640267.1 hypothetical protein TGRH88_041920 [Toxoplasma gondii]KFG34906.1 hypothetical protein TGFOU_235580 [Toxoplasma gondii FOU]KFG37197.1 hypothetical protein TGP89_235580 [Toxoplasma gondii p89]KFG62480.1 hypothetical protein TGRUB_235580 [Toxoplasma gondii RUB]KFH02175.1 hypothetical protein TGMAS_235580 [Toxoplasma gondii MAS]PUA85057.1 hypothetical prote